MLPKREVSITTKATRGNNTHFNRQLRMLHDAARLRLKRLVANKLNLGVWRPVSELIDNGEYWRNVSARPSARGENLHLPPPL